MSNRTSESELALAGLTRWAANPSPGGERKAALSSPSNSPLVAGLPRGRRIEQAYQELVDGQLVETRRGLGMFVNAGARNRLLKGEREKFLAEEWPRVAATIERLGITPEELMRAATAPKRKER